MNRCNRLNATFQGKSVDRPAVSFYEIGLFRYDSDDPDPFNVHNDPTWRPLLELAETQTDIIRSVVPKIPKPPLFERKELCICEDWEENGSKFSKCTIQIGGRTLQRLTRRDRDVDTLWMLEHLLKDKEDIEAYLQIPDELLLTQPDCSGMQAQEEKIGEPGISQVDTPDPLCIAASLFSMSNYTIFAMTESKLFHRLMEKCAALLYPYVEKIASEFPGRLWRIYGPEYACAPFLPPNLFKEYVVKYTTPIIKTIHKYGGYARIHAHGKLRNILPDIAAMGADALDPIEPAPQGDMELIEVRKKYGENMVLMGNIEITDIVNLSPQKFEPKIVQALREGTKGEGRGFILLPSACPYGRKISANTLANYETMVRLTNSWEG